METALKAATAARHVVPPLRRQPEWANSREHKKRFHDSALSGHDLVVAVNSFAALVCFLCLYTKCGDRACIEAFQANWLASFLAIAIGAIFNTPQGSLNFGNEFAVGDHGPAAR